MLFAAAAAPDSLKSPDSPFELVEDEGAGGDDADEENDGQSPNAGPSGSSMVSWEDGHTSQ